MAGIIGLYGNHFTVMEFTQKYMKDSPSDRDILLSMLLEVQQQWLTKLVE
jgi:hypothetical protein